MLVGGNKPRLLTMMKTKGLQIVLLGPPGVGKSTSANTIFGDRIFEEAAGFMSGTDTCKKHSGEVLGREVTVIDTPGLCDVSKTEDELKGEIQKCVELSIPGPHVFLLVIRLDVRFSIEVKNVVKWSQVHFGRGATCFTMVLFTHADRLKGISVKEAIRRVPAIQEIINTYGGRYHVFNNEMEEKQIQVRELLDKIDTMVETNGGEHYTNIMYQVAQRKMSEEEENKREEENERRRGTRERELREEADRNAERERVLREEAVRNAERERVLREEAVRNAERERVLREDAIRNAERERAEAVSNAERERGLREEAERNTERERGLREEAERQQRRAYKDTIIGAGAGGVGGGVGGAAGGAFGGVVVGASVGFIVGGPPGAALGAVNGARAGATVGGVTGAVTGIVEGYKYGGERGGAAGGRAGGITGTVAGGIAGYQAAANPVPPGTKGGNATNPRPAPDDVKVSNPSPAPGDVNVSNPSPAPGDVNVSNPSPAPDSGNVANPNPDTPSTNSGNVIPITLGTAGLGVTVTFGPMNRAEKSNTRRGTDNGNGANSGTSSNNSNGANSGTPGNSEDGANSGTVDASAILNTVVRTALFGGELGEVVGRLTSQGCEELIREIENVM